MMKSDDCIVIMTKGVDLEMMQVGNLAIVAAKHKDCMLQIYDNQVSVHTGSGNEKRTLSCYVNDDEYINKIIAYLNFGTEIVK